MTKSSRWLDGLPRDSKERGLLMAGRRARPPEGSALSELQAFNALLGAVTVVTAVTENAAAASTAATKTASLASATVTAKTAVVGGLGISLAVKSVVIGFTVGVGVLGVGTAAERAYQRFYGSSVAITAKRQMPSRLEALARSSEPVTVAQQHITPPAASTPVVDTPATVELSTTRNKAPSVVVGLEPRKTSLAEQAHELAQIKQLIDAGALAKALARLDASFKRDVHTALAEERDALYVQALNRSHQLAMAKSFATKFIARYPNSPHVEKMRALIAVE